MLYVLITMRILIFGLLFSFSVMGQPSILVLGNHSSVCLNDNLDFVACDTLPENLDNFSAIMLFSGSTSNLSHLDIERIVDFTENGGGLYSGAENWPLQAESNQMTNRLFKKESFGEYEQANAQRGELDGNLELEKNDVIPAGKTTVAFPMDYRLKVEAWVEDQPLILSGMLGQGRIIIDGGYSRFYCNQRNENSDILFSKIIAFLIN